MWASPEMNGNQWFWEQGASQVCKMAEKQYGLPVSATLADGIMGKRGCVSGRELPVHRELSHQHLPL